VSSWSRGEQQINALAMPNSFSSALEMRLAGLKVAGYARDGRGFLLSQRLVSPEGPHELESFWSQACQIVQENPAPPATINMRIAPQAMLAAQEIIVAKGWQSGYLCVNPFAVGTLQKQIKKWPEFPAFVKQLENQELPVVICPGPGEVEEARQKFSQLNILEGIPLDTYAALLQQATLVVTNDTGPAHIAAAVGARVISVLGPTNIEKSAPWGPTVTVLSEYPNWPQLNDVMEVTRRALGSTCSGSRFHNSSH
jgi:heptosyltransferase-2